jgi:hypothetical protein
MNTRAMLNTNQAYGGEEGFTSGHSSKSKCDNKLGPRLISRGIADQVTACDDQ